MITSKQNPLIKQIRSLSDKKVRDELNVFVVEGVKPVKEAIGLGLNIKQIVCTKKVRSEFEPFNVKIETVDDALFDYVSEEKTPQGALAVVYKPNSPLKAPKGNCILLDGVADPANVGAIIRTAAACGFNDVYMTSECADAYCQKAVRCSMSGIFRVNVMRASIAELLSVINLPICVADMGGQNVFTAKLNSKVCLVIGNEGRGVSECVRNKADLTVSIPMQNGVESLNAAVSAGILMYAISNQN